MSKRRLLSGRVKKKSGDNLDPGRYEYIDLNQAEPDLNLPATDFSVLTSLTTGTRIWSSILFADTSTVSITSTASATSTYTGALVVGGGVGIAENLWVGGQLHVNNLVLNANSLAEYITLQKVTDAGFTTTNRINVVNTTSSTSTDSGAVTISGGVGIGENLYVKGVVSAEGGFLGLNANAIYQNTSSVTVIDTGTIRQVSVVVAQTTTTVFYNTLTQLLSRVLVDNTSSTTSSTTGALLITGGVGVGENLYVKGSVTAEGGFYGLDPTRIFKNTSSVAVFDTGVVGNINVTVSNNTTTVFYNTLTQFNTPVEITTSTESVSTVTGALTVTGGVGIGGRLNVGGIVDGRGVRTSTTSTAPRNPAPGDIWYFYPSDILYRFIYDGTTSTWVDITGPTLAPTANSAVGYAGSKGDTGYTSGAILFLNTGTQSGAGYWNLDNNSLPQPEYIFTSTSIANGAVGTVAGFITQSGYPGVSIVPAGQWSFYLHLFDSGSNSSWDVYVDVYKVSATDVETLLYTTDEITILAIGSSPTSYDFDTIFPKINLLTTDRILVKIQARNNTGGSRSISLATLGTAHYSVVRTPLIVNQVTSGVQWAIVNTNTTMVTGYGYFVDTTGGPVNMTLPTTATLGDSVRINDLAGTFNSNAATVVRNGHTIQGVASDLTSTTAQASFGLVYSNNTYGWKKLEVF
jgi:hypothetical protein